MIEYGVLFQQLSVSAVLDFWRKLKFEIGSEPCERHFQFGLANQCATNMLIKYIYGSFLIVQSPDIPDIKDRVSDVFYQDLDFIMPMDVSLLLIGSCDKLNYRL